MITRSIVGRFLILAILIVAVGVLGQAAMIMMEGGKRPVKTAAAATLPAAKPAGPAHASAAQPVRVVYPGPLGDTPAPRAKLADAAPASPLAAPTPETTAKLVQAMGGAAPQPAAPQAAAPAPTPAAPPVAAAAPEPADAPAPPPAAPAPAVAAAAPAEPASAPAPAPVAAAPEADPAPAAAPAGVQVASLGGGAPAEPGTGSGVNINTASIEALNHLGGGHIGQSIIRHRPYHSVEDLVKKRVLRRSVYDQIKNEIAAQ